MKRLLIVYGNKDQRSERCMYPEEAIGTEQMQRFVDDFNDWLTGNSNIRGAKLMEKAKVAGDGDKFVGFNFSYVKAVMLEDRAEDKR